MAAHELHVINPYTESLAYAVPLTPPDTLDRIVGQARAAFGQWKNASIEERTELCDRFITAFNSHRETIAEEVTQQMGKPKTQALGEVDTLLDRARHMTAIAPDTLADESLPEKEGFVRYIRHEPLGVVLDIAAWNYPLVIAVNVVVPAVLAGNTVIIKHSSRTPLAGRAFVDAFIEAGMPEGLVQHVVADHAATERLIRHPGVDFVSFTGSVEGGRAMERAAAERFIGVGLELGGKDPAYVCADAPFDHAVDGCVDGSFYNAGQSCCAIERIYVDRARYDDFLEAFVEKTRGYVMGDPLEAGTTLGPLASPKAPAGLRSQVEAAVARGGRILLDGAAFDMPEQGWFMAPTVVADAPQDCALMQDESFGPVIGLRAVSGEDEALQLMNDSPYGLTASIWTADTDRARRVGAQIETGTFFMNRADYLDPLLPWTGVKDTGRGVTLSRYGLLQLSRLKSMHLRTGTP